MINRFKKYISFYRIAHHRRVQLYDLKWRLLFILLVASCMILIYEYMQNRYPYSVVDVIKGAKFALADRIFEWFSIGVIFGVIAISILHEGEFILGVRKLAKHFELQTQALLRHAQLARESRTGKAKPTSKNKAKTRSGV